MKAKMRLGLLALAFFAGCSECGPLGEFTLDDPEILGILVTEKICDPFGLPGDEPPACPIFPSAQPCRTAVSPWSDASVAAALDAGYTFSDECATALALVATTDIDPETGTWLSCEEDCQYFFGEQAEGAPCVAVGHRMSDCAQGLICAPDRRCHRPCDYSWVAPLGGWCGPVRGMWFVTCDAGLRCGSEGTCEPAAAIGESCVDSSDCAVGGWCDTASSLCTPVVADGTPCVADDQCESRVCVEGACLEDEPLVCERYGW